MAKAPGKRRRLYPMPVEPVIDHPGALALPSAAYGMLMRLCHHFWATECASLPTGDDDLRHLCRAHRPTWAMWQPKVMAILDDILPELEAYFNWREGNRAHLMRLGKTGNGIQRMSAMQRAARERGVSPNTLVIPKKQPRDAPPPVTPPVNPDRKRRIG